MKTNNTQYAAACDFAARRLLHFKRVLIEPFAEIIVKKFPSVNPQEIFSHMNSVAAIRFSDEHITVVKESALLRFMLCKEVHLILNDSTAQPKKSKNTFLFLEKLSA